MLSVADVAGITAMCEEVVAANPDVVCPHMCTYVHTHTQVRTDTNMHRLLRVGVILCLFIGTERGTLISAVMTGEEASSRSR